MSEAEWTALFTTFEHTAFRLEVRDRYDSPEERQALRQFVAGEPVELGWRRSWLSRVRAAAAAGRRVERVRVVSVPLTDYSRFGVFCSGQANAAGEDIRYLERDEARAAGLPDHDFWLFDSHRLARLHFDDDDVLLGAEPMNDPVAVVDANRWRDIAWRHAWLREAFTTS